MFKLFVILSLAILNYVASSIQRSPIIVNNQIRNKGKQNLSVIERTPYAILNSAQISIQSFFSNAVVMVPLCLVAGVFHKHPSRGVWFQKSLRSGLEWGILASVFSGAEELLKVLRDKDDVWNRSLASGLASGIVQMKEDGGGKGFAIGFIQGFGFLFVLDQFTNLETSPTIKKKSGKTGSNRRSNI